MATNGAYVVEQVGPGVMVLRGLDDADVAIRGAGTLGPARSDRLACAVEALGQAGAGLAKFAQVGAQIEFK